MEKLVKLKNSRVFNLLAAWLTLAGVGAMQYFLGVAYIRWTFTAYILLAIASCLCIMVFAFWFALAVLSEPKASTVAVVGVVLAVVTCFMYLASPALINMSKSNEKACFIFGAAVTDVILAVAFIVGWMSISRGNKWFTVASIAAVMVALIIGISVYTYNQPSNAIKNAKDEFKILDTLPDVNGTPVHVILLNGQSNASGVSRVPYLTEEQRERYNRGFDNVLINYFDDNGNNTSGGAFVHVGLNQGYSPLGFFGPEVGLAEKLSEERPGELFVIIKYAWGGSELNSQWLSNGKEGMLYNAFRNFTTKCMEYLRSRNYDAKIDAMCWMQGESDGYNGKLYDKYYDNTKALVSMMRRDMAQYASAHGIAFVDAAISDSPLWVDYKEINKAKQQFAADPANNAHFIDTVAAGLDYKKEPTDNPDLAHYDAADMLKLGNMFGEAILGLGVC